MAIQFTQKFASQKQAIYDVVSKSTYFNDDAYNYHAEKGDDNEYLTALYSMKNKALDFDDNQYKYLNYDDQLLYMYTKNGLDRTSDDYKNNMSYLNNQVQDGIMRESFNNMSNFEKTANSIGGIVGNTLNSMVLGTAEGLADAMTTILEGGAALIGQKEAATKLRQFTEKDLTGYHAIQKELADYAKYYTYLDKNSIWKIANDVSVGIGQMVPMIALNLVAPGAGTFIYFTSMAGNTAYDAISQNPEISTGKLLAYTGATTLVEFATEQVSGALFGGSMIDKAMGLSSGSTQAFSGVKAHWLGRLGLDFLSEGMEESISEIADTVLLETLVNNKSFSESLGQINMMDVLYAGLIGGLTGAVMTGTSLARTSNLAITEDGQIVDYKTAVENGQKVTKLNKSKSLSVLEALTYAQDVLKQDSLTDLELKAGGSKTLEQLKAENPEGYQKAIDANLNHKKDLAKAVMGLSRLLSVAGEQQFKKSADLLNATYDELRTSVMNYVNRAQGAIGDAKRVQDMYSKLNPGESITVKTDLSAKEARLKDFLKTKYGKDVYFVDYGSENGMRNQGTNIMGDTILLDSTAINTTTMNEILNTTVKHELAHSLQYDSGIMNAKTLSQLQQLFKRKTGDILTTDSREKGSTILETVSERQAEALVNAVLFDDLTINKVFSTNKGLFTRTYNWLKELGQKIKNSPEGSLNKIKYSSLVKSMYKYRQAIANRIGNEQDVRTAQNELGLTDLQVQELIDSYYPTYDTRNFTIMDKSFSEQAELRQEATQFLMSSRRDQSGEKFDFSQVFNPEYYSVDFMNNIMAINPETSFQRNLQTLIMMNYGMTINKAGECLNSIVDVDTVIKKEVIDNLKANNLQQYTTVGQLLDENFVSRLATPDGFNPINDTKITYNIEDTAPKVKYDPVKQEINITMSENLNEMQQANLYDSLVEELSYAIGNNMQPVTGTAPYYVLAAMSEEINKKTILRLASLVFTDVEYNNAKNNLDNALNDLAYFVYKVTDGVPEDVAVMSRDIAKKLDDLVVKYNRNEFKEYKQSGFITNGTIVKGYGIFTGMTFQVKNAVDSGIRNALTIEQRQISYSRTQYGDKGDVNRQFVDFATNDATGAKREEKLREAGFTEDEIVSLRKGEFTKSKIQDIVGEAIITNDKSKKVNLMLDFVLRDNKYLTNRRDILNVFKEGYSYVKILKEVSNPNSTIFKRLVSSVGNGGVETLKSKLASYGIRSDRLVASTKGKTYNELLAEVKNTLFKIPDVDTINTAKGMFDNQLFDLDKSAKKQFMNKLFAVDFTFTPGNISDLSATVYELATEFSKETQTLQMSSDDGGEEDYGIGSEDVHFAELREKVETKGIKSLTEKELKDYNMFVKPDLEEELASEKSKAPKKFTKEISESFAKVIARKTIDEIPGDYGKVIREYANAHNIKETSAEFVVYDFLVDAANYTDAQAKEMLTYSVTKNGVTKEFKFRTRDEWDKNISNNIKTINNQLSEKNITLSDEDAKLLTNDYKNFKTPSQLRNRYNKLKDLLQRIKKNEVETRAYKETATGQLGMNIGEAEPRIKQPKTTTRREAKISTELSPLEKLAAENYAEEQPSSTTRAKQKELTKNAVHFGTIQTAHKAETLGNGVHGTGGFGTGTYFMSELGVGFDRSSLADRAKNIVDLSKYNTLNVTTTEDAIALHDALNDFHSGVQQASYGETVEDLSFLDTLAKIFNISQDRMFNLYIDTIDHYTEYFDRWNKDEIYRTDKPQTYMMKKLGYEGINTMGLWTTDNSKYGTVIFDLDTKDLKETIQPEIEEDVFTEEEVAEATETLDRYALTLADIFGGEQQQQQQQQQQRTRSERARRNFEEMKRLVDEQKLRASETQDFDRTGEAYTTTPETLYDDFQAILLTIDSVDEFNDLEAFVKEYSGENADQLQTVFQLSAADLADMMAQTTDLGARLKDVAGKQTTKAAQWEAHLSAKSRKYNRNQTFEHDAINNLLNEFTKKGYTVNMDESAYSKLDAEFNNLKQKADQLEKEYQSLKNKLKDEPNRLERREILNEMKKLRKTIEAFMSNDMGAILDMILDKAQTKVDKAKKAQDILRTIVDNAEKVDGVTQEEEKSLLFTLLKKTRSYRMWAMTSSPISWFNNFVGNALQTGLDNASKFFERIYNKSEKIQGLYRSSDIKMNSDKVSRDVYDEFTERYGTVVDSFIEGTTGKYESITDTATIASKRELREAELRTATGFKKFALLAEKYSDWGLQKGPLGDERMMKTAMVRNFCDIVASNNTMLLEQLDADLRAGANNTPRAVEIEKALNTRNPMDIIDAMSQEEFETYMDYAMARASETYFKNPNALSEWVNNMAKKHPLMAEVFATCVTPFPKVATNILTAAYRYSPLGFISAFMDRQTITKLQEGKLSSAAKAELLKSGRDVTLVSDYVHRLSQATVGTIGVVAGAIAAALGWIQIDDDDYMGVCVKLPFNIKMSLSDIAPASTSFTTAAAWVYATGKGDNGLRAALDNVYDNTLLSNITSVFNYGSKESYGKSMATSYISSYIPAVFKTATKLTTGNTLKDKTASNYYGKLANTLKSYIPFVEKTVADKIDPYTGKKQYAAGTENWFLNLLNTLTPLKIKQMSNSDLETEAKSLNQTTTGTDGSFTYSGEKVNVYGKEKEALAKYRANYINDTYQKYLSGAMLVRLKDDTTNTYKTINYNKLTDAEKKRALENLYSKATEMTKVKYWLSQGNFYYTKSETEYAEYKRTFSAYSNQIKFAKDLTGSNFITK